ncbi:MAG TPA: hypothetical protein VFZ99_08120, partial [Terriglobales bacterium]
MQQESKSLEVKRGAEAPLLKFVFWLKDDFRAQLDVPAFITGSWRSSYRSLGGLYRDSRSEVGIASNHVEVVVVENIEKFPTELDA